ncbi:MAG: sugar phosphate isomerase/epimerase family protein [Clostridia bacterium]|nr:sugar phosphate isomerase/epimerase family protein [Clostridia bacterium]
MNIGIRLHDTRPGNLKERLLFAREQGFSCAHIAMSKAIDGFSMQDAPALLNSELAAGMRKDLTDTGISCAVLGCYLNLADPDAERRAATHEIYKAHLRFAAMTGAGVVGTETYANPESVFADPAPVSEEAYRLFIDSLRPVVRYAEETGTYLAVEPVWYHIISTPERAERMLNDVRSDHLRIILDTVNLIRPELIGKEDEVVDDAIRRFGDRISILHMKDYTVRDGKAASLACGRGQMRYEKLLAFAKANSLPMTLEDTVPENAEDARLYLERIGQKL